MKYLDIESGKLEEKFIVRLAGDLDAGTAVAADAALQEALLCSCEALLVDCSGLRYISSAGLGVIISTFHACNSTKTKLVFFGMQPKIKSVLHILGLEKVLHLAATQEEATQLLKV